MRSHVASCRNFAVRATIAFACAEVSRPTRKWICSGGFSAHAALSERVLGGRSILQKQTDSHSASRLARPGQMLLPVRDQVSSRSRASGSFRIAVRDDA
jgi:hypothetical protein